MPQFSRRSLDNLATCHPALQLLFQEAIKEADFVVLEGHRGREAQNKAFRDGKSGLPWPNSKHNQVPSLAADVAPWPLDWEDTGRFKTLATVIKAAAGRLNISIEWGGDWRSVDMPHWQLSENG
jgi:peptidoglycan LD-endopeptidase CwlK